MSSVVYRASVMCNSCGKLADFARPRWTQIGGYPTDVERIPDGWVGNYQISLLPGGVLIVVHICDECKILPFETVMANMKGRQL